MEHPKTTTFSPLKYGIDGYNRWLDPDGYPAIAPSWGTLNAIDLNTKKYVWKKPFGEFPALAAQGLHDTGSENYGGGVITAGSLFFIAATSHDSKMRAFDKANGLKANKSSRPRRDCQSRAGCQLAYINRQVLTVSILSDITQCEFHHSA